MREPAVTAAGKGATRPTITSRECRASDTGAANDWKHLTRQLPISGQAFCGQSGHDFIGLWQGISPFASAIVIWCEDVGCVPAFASA